MRQKLNHQLSTKEYSRRRSGRRGQAMIEFALCFLLFMAVVFGFSQIAMAVWMKSTLHFAVREGIRFAITGRTLGSFGHDASIKQVIRNRAGGVLSEEQADDLITIQYYDPSGVATTANTGGNTVVLTVNNYPVPMLTGSALSWTGSAITVSAKAVGRQEPYPNPPDR
jgi:Flp pilus assembly protein TadG